MSYSPSGQSDYKKSVRVATTSNVNLSSPGSSIDGVTLASGDRVLVKSQTTGSQNGIYEFDTSTTAMIRATDTNADGELTAGMLIPVEEGSTYADTLWIVSTDGDISLGTTSVSFAQITGSSGGSVAAADVSYAGSSNLSASNVEDALDELDSEKAAASHSHVIGDVTNLQASLDGKASSSHSHIVGDVTGLQTALDGKASSSHAHDGITPIGGVIDYFGSTEPSGWKYPNGQAISRTTYSSLFDLLGTAFGSGDGLTTFNLPDMRGRVAVMRDASAGVITGTDTLGSTEGDQSVTLTTAQIPSHNHAITVTSATTGITASTGNNSANPTVTDSGHSHGPGGSSTNFVTRAAGGSAGFTATGSNVISTTTTATATGTANLSVSGSHTHTVSITDTGHTHTASADNAGGGGSHQNMQPSIRVNKLIRVL